MPIDSETGRYMVFPYEGLYVIWGGGVAILDCSIGITKFKNRIFFSKTRYYASSWSR